VVDKQLGPYRILEQLGAGGMGQVWLAEDTRLGRKVAVKILPPEFAADPDRLQRFEQEARAAAALNHPNIAAIHDVGVATLDDSTTPTHYMVQEHLEGETLTLLISRGALPLNRAFTVATEIAEALKAAHRAGVVHRDLKPDNVFITPDGHAKVLDFGLAKLTELAGVQGGGPSMSPTVTMAGQIMGTAGYMSPEQVRGEEVDERADVFAFGCVLYELVTGERAFVGDNVHETLSRILTGQPHPLREVRQEVPSRLQWALDKLLAKEREQRYQTIADVVVDLRQLATDLESGDLTDAAPAAADTPTVEARRRSPVLVVAIAVLAVLAGALGAWMFKPSSNTPPPDVRFDMILSPDIGFASTYNRVVDIAPDGSQIAFTARDEIWLLHVDRTRPTPIENTNNARTPVFSPDSRQVAFWASGQVKRISTDGGVPVVLAPFKERPQGMSWADDGFIYIGRAQQGIWKIPEGGGEPEQVLAMEPGEHAHGPELLPGGEWMLYSLGPGVRAWSAGSIVAQSLKTNERRELVPRGREARYTPSGHLTYVQDGSLFAVPFDLQRIEVTGGALAMEDAVQTSAADETGAACYDVSGTGVLAYAPPAGFGTRDLGLIWLDEKGTEDPLPLGQRRHNLFQLSPDDRFIATQINDIDGTNIWIFPVDRDGGQRLTNVGRNTAPVWSHDGRWIYFASDRDGDIDIWRRPADMSEPAERVLDAEGAQIPSSTSTDGKWLWFADTIPSNADVSRLSLGGDPVVESVIDSPADELDASPSPDGRFFAFQSDATGRWDIHVMEIATGKRWIVSTETGYDPTWTRDGSRIAYRTSQEEIRAVTVRTDPAFAADPSELMTVTDPSRHAREYDVSRDGQRVLVGTADIFGGDFTKETRPRITVVLNWFEELKRRVPASGDR
jgi:serine/threonine-protein kinase